MPQPNMLFKNSVRTPRRVPARAGAREVVGKAFRAAKGE